MTVSRPRKALAGWFTGLIIVIAISLYGALHLHLTETEVHILAQIMVFLILPAVYLVLMYLTLKGRN